MQSYLSQMNRICKLSALAEVRRVLSSNVETSTSGARKGFGSFHSDNVEELVNLSSDIFPLPACYDKITAPTASFIGEKKLKGVEYGNECKYLFNISSEFTFLNHGAFGAAMIPLSHEATRFRYYCEEQPLRFFDRELLPIMTHSIRKVAKVMHCPPDELYPLPNVTSGMNAIATSLSGSLQAGDEVVCFSLSYGSTKKILKELCRRTGAIYVMVEIPFPIDSHEVLMSQLKKSVNASTKLVVLDAITSNTALVLPVMEMAAMCRELAENALVVVDAAHSLWSQDICLYEKRCSSADDSLTSDVPAQLSDVVDIYITNGHKWLSAPKGCAFMWLHPRVHKDRLDSFQLRPAVLSHGYDADRPNALLSAFIWDGCRDYSSMCTVPSALKLWDAVGGHGQGWSRALEYNRMLLDTAAQHLLDTWNISRHELLCTVAAYTTHSPMILIPLPRRVRMMFSSTGIWSDIQAFQLQELLHHKYAIEVPVKCLGGIGYVRLSAHIYNTIEDYEHLGSVIKNLNVDAHN